MYFIKNNYNRTNDLKINYLINKNIIWTFIINLLLLLCISKVNCQDTHNNNNNNNNNDIYLINNIKYLNNNNLLLLNGNKNLQFYKNILFATTKSSIICNDYVLLTKINITMDNNTTNIIINLNDISDNEQINTLYNDNNNNNNNIDDENSYYLCVKENNNNNGQFHHLGMKSKFKRLKARPRRSIGVDDRNDKNTLIGSTSTTTTTVPSNEYHNRKLEEELRIDGLRVEHSTKEISLGEDGVPELLSHTEILLRIFGTGINENTVITFTQEPNIYGGSCQLPVPVIFHVDKNSISRRSALVTINLPNNGAEHFYICAKEGDLLNATQSVRSIKPFEHQGTETWLRLKSYEPLLPLWASISIIVVCLTFSALFSGLNLGLMSLDRTELKILCNTGTDTEQHYARKIQPVRDHGNYLLCSILLGNVLVNSTFTILLDGLTSGLIAIICSTLLIVIFGEITPQAICSRHGLAVGAKTIFITKAVMFLTFPLSYPTSKILDALLGEEIGNVYNRERLKELVKVTTDINDLDRDEVNIISGALELRKKTVADVMTHIKDMFMLSLDAILDFETVSEIMKSGFSRIPVYESDRTNIVTLLFIKDLAFVDPDDNTQLKTLCEFYQNPCHFVFEDVTLDVMFKQFKEGHKGHMAFVHRVNSEGDGDPFYETIGLITLEDVIEELIQAEIMDETDVFTDNRTKVRRQRTKNKDFTIFAERRDIQRIRISPQLTLATFQYLSTTIDAFKYVNVSETILRRLLNQDIVHHLKCKGKDKGDPSIIIYQQGKPVDFFVLILEGRVEVTVGKENLVFESGPFTYFGTQALVQTVGVVDSPQQQIMGSLQSLNMDALLRHTFVPDYSVRAITEVVYIAIKRTLYLAAKRATLMERSQKGGESSGEPIDDEVEKLLHSLGEDDHSVGTDTANLLIGNNTPKASKPTSNAPSPILHHELIHPNGPTGMAPLATTSPNSLTSFNMSPTSLLYSNNNYNNNSSRNNSIGNPQTAVNSVPITSDSDPDVTSKGYHGDGGGGGGGGDTISVDTPLLKNIKS